MNQAPDRVRSSVDGVAWPAMPGGAGAMALAMQYQLEQTQWLTPEELRERQLRQFRKVLRHAVATVPYWRDRLAGATGRADAGMEWSGLQTLPLLTRADVQALGNALLSRSIPPEHGGLVSSETSGSTGRPINRYGTALTDLFWRAFTLREHFWHGRDFSGKLAAIRLKVERGEIRGWGPATDLVLDTGPCVLLNLRTDLDEQLDWLQAQAPQYLITNASNLLWLAQRSAERGIRLPGLLQARSYGGALPEGTRAAVRAAWAVELVDVYTAEEVGYIALQCPQHHHYHMQSEGLIVEILDDAGQACVPGQIGRVVVTTLHNYAMPLIRYELGDYAEAGAPCACGRGLPVIRRIMGHERNILRLPDGRRHWPSFPTDKWARAVPVIRQLQLVQKSRDHIQARIVAPRDLEHDESVKLIESLRDCLGHPFQMTVERVEAIARAGNYKFEDFISECAD